MQSAKRFRSRWLSSAAKAIMLLALTSISLFGVAACSNATAPMARANAELPVPSPIALSPPQSAALGPAADQAQPAPAKRIIVKNADLAITVESPSDTLDKILSFANGNGGWVVNSNTTQTTGPNGKKQIRATVEIRVPAEKLDQVVAQVRELAVSVDTFHVTGDDVTDKYVDLSSQLTNLQAAAAQLKKIMDNAAKTEDVLAVYRELTSVQGQIEQIQGKLNFYNQSAAFSAISVTISPVIPDVPPLEIAGWQPGKTINSAISALIAFGQSTVDILIWVVIVGLPILLVAAIVFVIWRRIRPWLPLPPPAARPTPPADRGS